MKTVIISILATASYFGECDNIDGEYFPHFHYEYGQ